MEVSKELAITILMMNSIKMYLQRNQIIQHRRTASQELTWLMAIAKEASITLKSYPKPRPWRIQWEHRTISYHHQLRHKRQVGQIAKHNYTSTRKSRTLIRAVKDYVRILMHFVSIWSKSRARKRSFRICQLIIWTVIGQVVVVIAIKEEHRRAPAMGCQLTEL